MKDITIEQLADLVTSSIAAQSVLLASVLRPLIERGALPVSELAASLDRTEAAALQRGTRETPALTGLIDLLRRDLGLSAESHRGDA